MHKTAIAEKSAPIQTKLRLRAESEERNDMPLYEYECTQCKRHTEKIQKFSDPEITQCPHCGGLLERVVSAPAISFKGSGWFADGYGNAKPAASKSESKSDSGSSSDSSAAASSSKESTAAPASSDSSSSATPAAAAPSTSSSDKK
jgi:putative FmdB family regulatory protein